MKYSQSCHIHNRSDFHSNNKHNWTEVKLNDCSFPSVIPESWEANICPPLFFCTSVMWPSGATAVWKTFNSQCLQSTSWHITIIRMIYLNVFILLFLYFCNCTLYDLLLTSILPFSSALLCSHCHYEMLAKFKVTYKRYIQIVNIQEWL